MPYPLPPALPHPLRFPLLITLALAGAGVAAQPSAPPIKPGLWQVQSEREVDGRKAPDPMERMKNLPPEARRQMEATMKQRGVDMGQGGVQKICHTRESLDQGRWRGDSARCKTELTSRSAAAWTWRSVCTSPESEMEGEARFTSPEAYTVKTLLTMKRSGQAQTMRMLVNARWLGADCGELKPLQPPSPAK